MKLAITLSCSHCCSPELTFSDVNSSKSEGKTEVKYDVTCSCGATAKVVEHWDISKADPDKKSEAILIGII